MDLITLKSFDSAIEAHILKTRLESENIASFIFDENFHSAYPLFNLDSGGVKLKINPEDLQKANNILQKIQNGDWAIDNLEEQ